MHKIYNFASAFCINIFWTDPSFCDSRGLLSRHFADRCWTVAVLVLPGYFVSGNSVGAMILYGKYMVLFQSIIV